MPSVGALTVSLKAETESLRNDLNKAMGHIKALERETKRTSDSVRGAFDKIGVGGETLKRSFGQIATGILLMTDAASGAGKVGKLLEQSFGAFLVGGPLGAGVAAVSGLFKMLADDQEASRIATEKASEAQKKWFEGVQKQARESRDRIRDMNDEIEASMLRMAGAEGNLDLVKMQNRLREARDELKAIDAEARKPKILNRVTGADGQFLAGDLAAFEKEQEAERRALELKQQISNIEGEIAKTRERNAQLDREAAAIAKRRTDSAEAEKSATEATRTASEELSSLWRDLDRDAASVADTLRDWVESMDEMDALARRQADAAEAIVRKYDNQRQIAAATTDEERDRLEVLGEIDRLLSSNTISVADATDVFDAMMGAKDADRARKLRDSMEREAEKAGRASGEKAGRSFSESFGSTVEVTIDPFISSVFQTIEGGLTAAIVDGITNGGRNGADIFRNIVNQLLSQTISSILSSGLQAVLGGIFGGGGGGLGGIGGIATALIGGVTGGTGTSSGGIMPLPALDTGFT